MDQSTEKRLLQAAMATACIAPVTEGILGMAFGAGMLDYGSLSLLGFATTIPSIEKQGTLVTLLTAIVLIGGLTRLYRAVVDGWPHQRCCSRLVWSWA